MIHFRKLNQKGFGHHLIIPALVVLTVVAIGGYVLVKGHAQSLPKNTTSNISTNTSGSKFLPKASSKNLITQSYFDSMASSTIPGPNIINYPATVRYGDYNNTVGALQMMVHQLGSPNAFKDGQNRFGTYLKQIIIAIQTYNHLTVDGIVGQNTWRVILTTVSNQSNNGAPAVPISDFSLTNFRDSVRLTYKSMNGSGSCNWGIESENYSNYTGTHLTQDAFVQSPNQYSDMGAVKGPNVIGTQFWCQDDVVAWGATTWYTIQH